MKPSAQRHTARSTTLSWGLALWISLLPMAARSQVVWDNGSGDNQWGTALNWSTNSVPTPASNVQFNATDDNATVGNISLNADRAANSLTFNSVNDNFSLLNGSGNRTLRLTSRTITRTAGSSGNQTLAFTTLAPQNDWDGGWTFNIAGSGRFTISSNITGGWGNNVKSGAGTLVLSGNNTFGGVTNINAGTLVAASNTALGSSTWGNTIASGAALHLRNNITLAEQQFQVAGTGVGNTGAIRNLSGANTLASALNLAGATTITSASGSLTVTGQVSLGGNTLTVNGAGGTAFSNQVGGTGGVTKAGSGTLTFSGSAANSFGGALAIDAGTVALAKTAGTNAIGGGIVNVGDGSGTAGTAVLRLEASNQIADYAGLVTLDSDGVLQVNNFTEGINLLGGTGLVDLATSGYLTVGVNSGSSSFGGSITGSGTFEKAGSGTLTLTNDIDFAGTLTLSGGTLALGNIDLAAGTLNITGNSIIDFGGTSTLDITNLNISSGVTLTIQNWADASDFFFAQNWAGAVFNATGANPMNQVVFSGFAANDTKWQEYDRQVTPVPEPSTYGALLLAAAGGLLAWRRLVRRPAA